MSNTVHQAGDRGNHTLGLPESPLSFIDISMPITSDTVSWSDRFPPTPQWHSRIADGDATSNSTWALHSHTGTHIDAPLHHIANGSTIRDLELTRMVGPCTVLDLTSAPGNITRADLIASGLQPHDRAILKTRNSMRKLSERTTFEPDYVGIDADGAGYLTEIGTLLVGIDYLSIEPYGDASFPTHETLLSSETLVLEGLALGDVEPGRYLLLFLPIPLFDSEAAPGRAVLLPLENVKGAE